MTRPVVAALAAAAALIPGLLIPGAPVQARDARLVSHLYNPDEVVTIDGRAGVQATIAFADDEHIENVAIGDATSWQVTPNKRANILFVKPLAPRGRTNLTVVTDRHTYLFDLVAGGSARPVYVLRFTYPAEPAPAPKPAVAAITAEEAAAVANPPREEPAADPARLNFAWRTRGSARLLPARIYDDGAATYLTWDARAQVPAILMRNEKGEEGAVNYAVRDGVIVMDGVPATIILRAGKDMATIDNQAPRAARSAVAAATPAALPSATPPIALPALPAVVSVTAAPLTAEGR